MSSVAKSDSTGTDRGGQRRHTTPFVTSRASFERVLTTTPTAHKIKAAGLYWFEHPSPNPLTAPSFNGRTADPGSTHPGSKPSGQPNFSRWRATVRHHGPPSL